MQRGGKRRYFNRHFNKERNNWNETATSSNETSRHPPGLKGKEIGLHYKNLAKNKKKTEHAIKFSIPQSVIKRVQVLLQSIGNTQVGKTIKEKFIQAYGDSSIFNFSEKTHDGFKKPQAVQLPDFISIKTETDLKPLIYSDHNISTERKPHVDEPVKPISFTSFSANPGSSATNDFIDVGKDNPSTHDSSYNFISLKGNGDYFKFGYNDIITGSFEEKLNESISKGIAINVSTENTENLNKAYLCEYEKMTKCEKYKRMMVFRKQLPAYKKSAKILQVIENNQVIVISGETGCGKSTQVPQIILDSAISKNRGAHTKIMVTQPRRIAASSLAKRVSAERGENLGASVGYIVRLEKADSRPRCSITYCTTGILLADLECNQALNNISHVILDEVHERDTHVDLTMCMLRQVITKRKDLKLILMSATIDADRLSEYFNGCPVMHIEGLAYPVKDIFLEEILELTKFTLDETSNKKDTRRQHHGRKQKAQEMSKEIAYKAEISPWIESIRKQLSPIVFRTLLDYRIEELNMDLILQVVIHICKGQPGAILIFLPGIAEISKLIRLLDESNFFPKSKYDIYPLHSKLPSLEQHKIFETAPPGRRKIIIATNIAETSITIDDIVYVVDCGKIKMKGLNVEDNLATLKVEWVSQANLRQRRGRAGRCQPGICYHLVTSHRANKLQERLLPELQRSDLLEEILTIKKLRLGKAAHALNMVPDPPALSTVQWAISHLRQCGALNADEILTPLGWHLARLPVHPSAGKLLILGTLFGCLNRAACVAAICGFKDPFQLVIGKEKEVDEAKRSFTLGEPSDHVAMSEAIINWERLGRERRNFAWENFLSHNTLELLVEMKNQFGNHLKEMGFLPSGSIKSNWENRNNDNLSLFKAIVAASLYPNIARVRWVGLNSHKRNPRVIVRTSEGRVQLHPSSVMATKFGKNRGGGRDGPVCDNPGANWLAYWLKQKSSDIFLIDVTLVYTLPMLFFGELHVSDVEHSPKECYISISNFKVQCQKEIACHLFELRSLLDHVMASKVTTASNHSIQQNEFEETVLNAVIEMITAEDERIEYASDDDDVSGSDYSDSEVKHKHFHRRK